ncbi:DNA-binding transcriptional regulator, MarR family [Bradyrhizobium erythrophlei]|uniref:DNA-binding transcriptional regulator, MarR family n=2 Tax=Bradyrhizobium erythrophlei TaxID=1437360 RepID=A0A1M5XXX6_9BRAD|nr:DNA-binding transcriptional regulator, MarR family [Bradyrhizobium erythrophlei]
MTNLSPHQKTLMTAERQAVAQALFLALEPFVKESPTITLGNFMTFLRVASAEGKGVTEYADAAGVYKTVMTRHLLDLGDRDRHGEDGLGFIQQVRDRKDMRINRAWITHKGASFLDSAYKALSLLLRA